MSRSRTSWPSHSSRAEVKSSEQPEQPPADEELQATWQPQFSTGIMLLVMLVMSVGSLLIGHRSESGEWLTIAESEIEAKNFPNLQSPT